jgi:hypothetical protein
MITNFNNDEIKPLDNHPISVLEPKEDTYDDDPYMN